MCGTWYIRKVKETGGLVHICLLQRDERNERFDHDHEKATRIRPPEKLPTLIL